MDRSLDDKRGSKGVCSPRVSVGDMSKRKNEEWRKRADEDL